MATQNHETRAEGTDAEVQAAQAAAAAVADMLDLLSAGAAKQPGLKERTEKLEREFVAGTANIRAQFTLASDGLISIEFFALRANRPPQPIFDCVPSRKLDS